MNSREDMIPGTIWVWQKVKHMHATLLNCGCLIACYLSGRLQLHCYFLMEEPVFLWNLSSMVVRFLWFLCFYFSISVFKSGNLSLIQWICSCMNCGVNLIRRSVDKTWALNMSLHGHGTLHICFFRMFSALHGLSLFNCQNYSWWYVHVASYTRLQLTMFINPWGLDLITLDLKHVYFTGKKITRAVNFQ